MKLTNRQLVKQLLRQLREDKKEAEKTVRSMEGMIRIIKELENRGVINE